MKLAVIGSRDFDNYTLLKETLDKIISEHEVTTIVSRGARGADKLSELYAMEKGINIKVFPALWDKYGKQAGYKRNWLIVDYSDKIVAFWDGKSKGTQHSLNIAEKMGKEVVLIKYKEIENSGNNY